MSRVSSMVLQSYNMGLSSVRLGVTSRLHHFPRYVSLGNFTFLFCTSVFSPVNRIPTSQSCWENKMSLFFKSLSFQCLAYRVTLYQQQQHESKNEIETVLLSMENFRNYKDIGNRRITKTKYWRKMKDRRKRRTQKQHHDVTQMQTNLPMSFSRNTTSEANANDALDNILFHSLFYKKFNFLIRCHFTEDYNKVNITKFIILPHSTLFQVLFDAYYKI